MQHNRRLPAFRKGCGLWRQKELMNFYEDHQREGRFLTWLGVLAAVGIAVWFITANA
jgi:hypothetical protein